MGLFDILFNKREKLSIENSNVVDAISFDETEGKVVLLLVDGMDWSDEYKHLNLLQAKLNNYINYLEIQGYIDYLSINSVSINDVKCFEIKISMLYEDNDNFKKLIEHFEKVIDTVNKNITITIESNN